MFCHTTLISTVQVWWCREDLELEGREGRVTCSLTLLCSASPCMRRYCTHPTTLHSPEQHLPSPPLSVALFHRIMSASGPTSSPLYPLGLTNIIMPDFSILAMNSLLNLLSKGSTTINSSQVAEVKELARVLELREVEEEEVSGGLVCRG